MPHNAIELRRKHFLDEVLLIRRETAQQRQDVLCCFADIDTDEPVSQMTGNAGAAGTSAKIS